MNILVLMDMPLFPYRVYAYNDLVLRGYQLTVVSVSNKSIDFEMSFNFKHIILRKKEYYGFVKLLNFSSINLADYDIIVVDPNLRMLDYYQFYRKKYWDKLIGWGHHKGRTTGNVLAEWFRYCFFTKFKALVFYEAQTRDEYVERGFDLNKLFVANNTQYVNIDTVKLDLNRHYFTYVGRIQERKRVDLALKAFAFVKSKVNDDQLKFVLIGSGETNALILLSQQLGIDKDVIFAGSIHDENQLGDYFNHTIAYVSPGHVGLGVLHSLAFGVPVITCKDRKHSLEIVNCNKDNSFLVDFDYRSIARAMMKLYLDEDLRKSMSKHAFEYYQNNCTIEKMVNGLDDAIKFISR